MFLRQPAYWVWQGVASVVRVLSSARVASRVRALVGPRLSVRLIEGLGVWASLSSEERRRWRKECGRRRRRGVSSQP